MSLEGAVKDGGQQGQRTTPKTARRLSRVLTLRSFRRETHNKRPDPAHGSAYVLWRLAHGKPSEGRESKVLVAPADAPPITTDAVKAILADFP